MVGDHIQFNKLRKTLGLFLEILKETQKEEEIPMDWIDDVD